MEESLLLEGVRSTGTEFWNDSCGVDELRYAIANGATGGTSNPPIVLAVVRADRATWHEQARRLATEHASWGELDVAWALLAEAVTRGAAELLPVFEATGGARGRLSAQVNPRLHRDTAAMLSQAAELSSLAPNIQVKLPVNRAGLAAIEEATVRGIEINATANFTVSGAIAVADAVERGLARRTALGLKGDLHPVCTLMVGRLDDWVKAAADRDGVLLTPGRAEWAGVAVFKRALAVYEARGYRTRLLAGAFRHHLPWSQLLGADTILTIPPAWQRWINASGLEAASRVREPVDPGVMTELLDLSPEFRLAYEPDGLGIDDLEQYGAFRRTLRQFLLAYQDLQAEVRDAIVPDPDR